MMRYLFFIFRLSRLFVFAVISTSLLFCTKSQAFPELVRHNYNNCITCHVSPTGGGAITEYGRELSRDILSTWGRDKESQFAYVIPAKENLTLGGDVRTVYLYRDNPQFREGKWLFMQADLEAYYTFLNGKVTVGGTAGAEKKDPDVQKFTFLSRRHFVSYRHNDHVSVRAGRFMPAFGINSADHIIVTKRDLGFDQGRESYNVEASYIGENWNHYGTAIFGRPDEKERKAETGAAWTSSYAFLERFKAGGSYLHGENEVRRRDVIGVHGILGFTEKLFLLTEFDTQWLLAKAAGAREARGFVTHNKLGYEIYRGIVPYVTSEISYLDAKDVTTRVDIWGAGLQFFPRPHLEGNFTYQKKRSSAFNSQYTDVAYLLLHYYL